MRILQFGDSTLPVGAFSFSNGVESAIQTGIVRDLATLEGFVRAAASQSAHLDGVALLAAHRAAAAQDLDGVMAADAAISLRRVGDEQRIMSTRMGKKLGELAAGLFGDALLAAWLTAITDGRTPGCYPIAHGFQRCINARSGSFDQAGSSVQVSQNAFEIFESAIDAVGSLKEFLHI